MGDKSMGDACTRTGVRFLRITESGQASVSAFGATLMVFGVQIPRGDFRPLLFPSVEMGYSSEFPIGDRPLVNVANRWHPSIAGYRELPKPRSAPGLQWSRLSESN